MADSGFITFAVTVYPLAFQIRALHERILIKFDIVELHRRVWGGLSTIYFTLVFVLM
jgi:hypothetical protein